MTVNSAYRDVDNVYKKILGIVDTMLDSAIRTPVTPIIPTTPITPITPADLKVLTEIVGMIETSIVPE